MNNYNPFSLKGKTILVTGASSGIGKAISIESAKMGANIIVSGRNEERLNSVFTELDVSEGQSHKSVVADLNIAEDVEKLVSQSKDLNGLVLSSGIGFTLPFQFASRDKFDEIFNTNFFAPIELMRLLFKKKCLAKESSVVAIASLGGTKIFSGGNSTYGASKAALNAIAKFCAKEFSTRKVRVNSICPGMVETPLIRRGTITEEQLQADMAKYPLKRYGTPDDIAYGAIYLLSDASSWLTGHSLVLDGGISI